MGAPPPRWMNCPRKSQLIADKFIACKTFLDDKFNHQVPLESQFMFPMLLSYMESNKKELGLLISLTNTNRFYNRSVVEEAGVKFCKIACRGHDGAPTVEQTNMFVNICQKFFERNPGKIIGVHCTHGFNRTGFLIVSYLYEAEGWSLDAALDLFSKCRPPGIYKGEYIQELYKRFGTEEQNPPPPPALPDWCFDEDEEASGDEDHDNSSLERAAKRKRRPYNDNAKFCNNLNIETVMARGAERIQELCEGMLAWDKGNFPGSQPVSMDRKNLEFLGQKPYRVSWKADGTRYIMLILKENEVYFLDRDNSVFVTDKIKFPRRKNPEEHIFDTVVDGELVIDKEGSQTHPRFLIYDIIKFEGQDVGHTDLDRRHLCIDKEIIKPRNDAAQAGRLDKSKEPFAIRKKDFYPCEKAIWVLEKLVPKIPHETDGLIFQPLQDPYTPGQCPFVLKWKPHELNSVDFLLNIATIKQVGCLPERVGCLYVQGYDQPFSKIKVTSELKHYDKRIIECTWENNQWKFLRVREDKSFPNALKTAQSVCASITHPVTKELLNDYLNKYLFRTHGAPQFHSK
ncbi:mRNA-capping enzyme isoform X2 [Hydra vulgaris]|uniref:mRNA-capping enzyme n=1 Tax=Hydra vulgaris TaxID=6087 RepID=A0ABM4BU00_HYDVU